MIYLLFMVIIDIACVTFTDYLNKFDKKYFKGDINVVYYHKRVNEKKKLKKQG